MRYHAHTEGTRREMMETIGISHVDALYAHVPAENLLKEPLDLPRHQGELEVERHLSSLARQNHAAADGPFFLGAGCYRHHIPATVDYVIQRSEFLTSYTPYQPEVSQGTLAAIFEFQSYIAALTGQDVANASMYDGATAMTEAALMARRIGKNRHDVLVAGHVHPHYVETLQTYWENYAGDVRTNGEVSDDTACVIVQSPDFHGNVVDLEPYRAMCDKHGSVLIVVTNEILSLGLLPAPAQADIVCGEAQSIGVGLQFGGPHLGFFACKEKYLRQMPGRLCGETVDADGKRSFVLTLNTREQHIRREKATSNICTNQGLMALAFTVHVGLLGESGFKKLARLNHEAACYLSDQLAEHGYRTINTTFFNEFVVELPFNAQKAVDALAKQGIVAGYPLAGNQLLVTATELTTKFEVKSLCHALDSLKGSL